MASTLELLRQLTTNKVEFVLVGGMAAIAHGSTTVTEDVDICLSFDHQTLSRLWPVLRAAHAKERMNPKRPELNADPAKYVGYRNLYLTTDLGQLDLLGELIAVGSFESVARHSVGFDLGGFECRVVDLDTLIVSKTALGRPKDKRVVIELEAVRARRDQKP